jgi:hypothetical protein
MTKTETIGSEWDALRATNADAAIAANARAVRVFEAEVEARTARNSRTYNRKAMAAALRGETKYRRIAAECAAKGDLPGERGATAQADAYAKGAARYARWI